jgi:hypothetical protein
MLAKAAGVRLALGARILGTPARAASHPHVQNIKRPEVCRETEGRRRPIIDPPAHAVVLSVDEEPNQALGLGLSPLVCR